MSLPTELNEYENSVGAAPAENLPVIDNSNTSYRNRVLCVRLNDKDPATASKFDETEARKNKLKSSYTALARKYKSIRELEDPVPLRVIVNRVFPDGIPITAYVRNLTFKTNKGTAVPVMAMRPKTAPGDFIHQLLPEGVSLIFKGHIRGSSFVIDRIDEVADTEQLDYEAVSTFTPRRSETGIYDYNFLKEMLEDTQSLTAYTRERLTQWQDYLKWRRELAQREIHGIKYYKLSYNAKKKRLVVWLAAPDEEYFNSRKKYLARDMQLFDNNYSENPWEFSFNSDKVMRANNKPIELGRYRGIADSYYLEREPDPEETEEIGQSVTDDDTTEYPEETAGIGYEFSPEDDDEIIGGTIKTDITDDDLWEHFETPYVAQAEYELSRDELDELAKKDFADDYEEETYITSKVIAKYYKNGFLANSAVGDFALIRRFEWATKNFENNEYWSPNLAVWLFDITKARRSDPAQKIEITEWLNKDIENNENQRLAVMKMLLAPDVCLIQGPPGTGKTTVIAEAVYQFVKMGMRVLIVSQSNDAVDNALERLADTSAIRAVRIGQQSGKKNREETGIQKFSEKEALKYYYASVAAGIKNKWLDLWKSLKDCKEELLRDRRDVTFFRQDILEYETLRSEVSDLESRQRSEMMNAQQAYDRAFRENEDLRMRQIQYRLFRERLNGSVNDQFFLSDSDLKIAEEELSGIINDAAKIGVMLTPDGSVPDGSVSGSTAENRYLAIFIDRAAALEGLADKLANSGTTALRESKNVLALRDTERELKDKLAFAVMDNNDTEVARLRSELQRLTSEINDAQSGSGSVPLSSGERAVLSPELAKRVSDGDIGGLEDRIRALSQKAAAALENTRLKLEAAINGTQPHDLNAYLEEVQKCEAAYNASHERLGEIEKALDGKRGTLSHLAEKYNAASAESVSVLEAIDAAAAENDAKLEEQSSISSVWEEVMTRFIDRLSGNSYKLDKDYNDIYSSSCNVVGVSCTDKKLSEQNSVYDDFDVVIIDEVSKATPPEMLIPLMRAKKAILVGDHRQLPPMFKEHEQSYSELIANTDDISEEYADLMTHDNFVKFRNMVTSSLFKEYFEKADDSIKHSLLVQYRMHSDIMAVINRFYEMKLENGLSAESEAKFKHHGVKIKGVDGTDFIVPEKHAYWLDSSNLYSEKHPEGVPMYDSRATKNTADLGGTSVFNLFEKELIIESLKKIANSLRGQGVRKTVGVISFYQSQVNRLREDFKKAKKTFDFSPIDVEINTVDRFQGKEKNIVIVSLVRNNKAARAGAHVVAFERINVAFSRAQELLLIVGAKHLYENMEVKLPNMDSEGTTTAKVYAQIIEELNRRGALISSSAVVTPELEAKIIKEYKEGDV